VQVLDEPPLCNPSLEELADQFGFAADVGTAVYDVAIVGAGPGGAACRQIRCERDLDGAWSRPRTVDVGLPHPRDQRA
jgi:hypothetical protein